MITILILIIIILAFIGAGFFFEYLKALKENENLRERKDKEIDRLNLLIGFFQNPVLKDERKFICTGAHTHYLEKEIKSFDPEAEVRPVDGRPEDSHLNVVLTRLPENIFQNLPSVHTIITKDNFICGIGGNSEGFWKTNYVEKELGDL